MLSHIEALIRERPIPQPPLNNVLLTKIIEILCLAWERICLEHPQPVKTGTEADVALHLKIAFNDLVASDSFVKNVVSQAVTAPETPNYNGKGIQKRPDIAILWNSPTRILPLSIECKLVDGRDKKTVALYTSKGMVRFVDGTYAWSEREGIMIAFVRDLSTLQTHLFPHMAKQKKKFPDRLRIEGDPEKLSHVPDRDLGTSRHMRAFKYPLKPGIPPGAITLWHLWLTDNVVDEAAVV